MKFLTFLNNGCVDICKNMLRSAELVGISMDDFYVACLDSVSYEKMKEYPRSFLWTEQEITEYQNWTFDENSGFRKIVKLKWKLISEIYKEHKNLCWVDTDIVFKQDPTQLIENNQYMLFQCDRPGSLICSGFMVFNNSSECEQLITECSIRDSEDDQLLINDLAEKYKNNIALLGLEYFPNGHVYYKQGIKDKAIIIHNNHMVGVDTKMQKFKEENLWYI